MLVVTVRTLLLTSEYFPLQSLERKWKSRIKKKCIGKFYLSPFGLTLLLWKWAGKTDLLGEAGADHFLFFLGSTFVWAGSCCWRLSPEPSTKWRPRSWREMRRASPRSRWMSSEPPSTTSTGYLTPSYLKGSAGDIKRHIWNSTHAVIFKSPSL